MKYELISYRERNLRLSLVIYFPGISFRKKHKCQIGLQSKEYKSSQLDFPTAIKVVELKDQMYFLLRLLGIGFSFHIKEFK